MVYYWHVDPSKINHGKAHGQWLKGRISSQSGAICIIDIGTSLLRVNQSKLRKAHGDWSDVDVPLEEEAIVDLQTLSSSLWLAQSQGKCDVQEFYSGSMHLSSACANTALTLAPPIDLRLDLTCWTRRGHSLPIKCLMWCFCRHRPRRSRDT